MEKEYYKAKGTLQVCPHSNDPAIVESFESNTDKSQCPHSRECAVESCPLEQELKRF